MSSFYGYDIQAKMLQSVPVYTIKPYNCRRDIWYIQRAYDI